MGLRTILRNLKRRQREVRLLILGLDNAGKTTMVRRLLGEDVDTVSPTLGFHIHSLSFHGHQLSLWDVGGQKSLRSYWRNYFEDTDCLVWVVDSSDRQRLTDCRRELEQLLQEERMMGASLLVLANKQDLPHSLPVEQIRDLMALDSITTHNWNICGCSAFSGDNVLPGIEWLVSDVSSRLFSMQ